MAEKKETYRPKRLTFSKPLPGGARERLREAILYVSEKCENAPRFGMIILNKIVWRADFTSFEHRKVPITGAAYHKLPLGPAPIDMRPVLEEMRDKGEIEIRSIDVDGKSEKRPIAVYPAHANYFTPDELKYLDEAINYYWGKTGSKASDDSHGAAWKTRAMKDRIPYEAVFFNDAPLSKNARKRFAQLAHEKQWVSR